MPTATSPPESIGFERLSTETKPSSPHNGVLFKAETNGLQQEAKLDYASQVTNLVSDSTSSVNGVSPLLENGDSVVLNDSQLNMQRSLLNIRASRSALMSQYNQAIYKHASKVFLALQHEPRDDGSFESAQKRKLFKSKEHKVPEIDYRSEIERKLTLQLAYSTLKYQYILEDLLEDVAFFIKYPELQMDAPLVMTIMYDYLQRKFLRRELEPGEITYPEVQEVEQCLLENKVRLDAALARRRIKDSARSVEDLLPSNMKIKEEYSHRLLTYAWINYRSTKLEHVIEELQNSGYEVLPESSQHVTDHYFCLDNLFDDTLVFSTDQAMELSNHSLVQQGHLVMQDKTSLFGPHTVVSLLNGAEDILVIDYNCGATAAHISSLMKHSGKTGYVYMFGVRSPQHLTLVQNNLDRLNADNVRVIDGKLDSLEHDDIRLRNVKVALIHGQCSKSAVLDPVGFVITEGEDVSILQDLSLGKPPTNKVNEMSRNNLTNFRFASNFPKMQAVVYVTRSILESENEKIVNRVVEAYNSQENRKYPFRLTPPLFKFDLKMAELQKNEKFYHHPPSEQANGCFLAIISKQIEDVKESTQAVLQRANATGLLGDKSSTSDKSLPSEEEGVTNTSSKSSHKTKKSKSRKSTGGTSTKKKSKKTKSATKAVAFGSSAPDILPKKSIS